MSNDDLIIDNGDDEGKKKDTQQSSDRETTGAREERRDERNSRDRDDDRYEDDRPRRRGRGRDNDEPRRAWNMGSLGRALNQPKMSGVSDAALASLIDDFKQAKAFDNPNVDAEIQQSRFQVLPYTNRKSSRSLPALLVCLPLPNLAGGVTLVYTLAIEQPGPQATRSSTSRGETYDALVLPEDRMNESFLEGVREEAKGLGGKNKVILVGSQVILSDVISDLVDKENSRASAAIFDNAIAALCGYRMQLLTGLGSAKAINFKLCPEAIEPGDRLEVALEYNQPYGVDVSGQPIRSEAVVTTFYSERTDDDEEDQYDRTPMVESRVSLEMFIQDEQDDRGRSRLSRRRRSRRDRDDDETAFMQGVLNINSIDSVDGYPYSLGLVGLAIAGVALLTNDGRYTNMIRPKKLLGGRVKPVFDPADLLRLAEFDEEADRREAMELVTANMDDDDFADFVDNVFKPDVSVGMVVSDASPNAWALSIFTRIALEKDQKIVDFLVNQLFDEWDVLTGNRFRTVYRDLCGGKMAIPVESAGTRVLNGTWEDPDTNVKRPASEWNVGAYLTRVGAKDLEAVRDFQYTFEDTRHSVDYNLAERFAMIKKVAPGLHISSTSEQLVFNRHLPRALAVALDEARMSPYVAGGDTLSGRRQVGNRLFSSQATSDAGTSRRSGRRGRDDDRGRSFFTDTRYRD